MLQKVEMVEPSPINHLNHLNPQLNLILKLFMASNSSTTDIAPITAASCQIYCQPVPFSMMSLSMEMNHRAGMIFPIN